MLKKLIFLICCSFLIMIFQCSSKDGGASEREDQIQDKLKLESLEEIEITEDMLNELEELDEEEQISMRKKLNILMKYVLLKSKAHWNVHKNKYIGVSASIVLLIVAIIIARKYKQRAP